MNGDQCCRVRQVAESGGGLFFFGGAEIAPGVSAGEKNQPRCVMGVLKTNFLTPWGGTNAILSISLDLVCCIDRSMAPPVQLYVLHILFF